MISWENAKFLSGLSLIKAIFEKPIQILQVYNELNIQAAIFKSDLDISKLQFIARKKAIVNLNYSYVEKLPHISIILITNLIEKSLSLQLIFPNFYKGTIIINSNFVDFHQLCFDGNIEDVRFINVNWGEVSKERFCPDITDYRKKRDIFRQIKLALDKQEN